MRTFYTVLASEFDSEATVGGVDFWETGLGSVIGEGLRVFAILIVLFAFFRGVKNFTSGKVGDAFKGVIGALLVAIVLFNPTLISSAIGAGAGLVSSIIETFGDLVGGASA